MLLRRIAPVALAAVALAACEPSLPKASRTNPSTADYIVFDPATSQIPLPNDLALLPQTVSAASGAQQAILRQFQAAGGFPNDQEVPITIDVQRLDTASGAKTPVPESEFDVKSINAAPGPTGNVLVLKRAAGASTAAPVAPTDLSFAYHAAKFAPDRGTLEIHNAVRNAKAGSLAWDPGAQYVVLVRGGANGVKLQGGGQLNAMQTMFLLTRGVDLSNPANQTTATRGAIGQQLEQLRQALLPAFAAADQVWGAGASQEIASAQAFTIAPAATGTAVVTDPSASKLVPPVPLPSDLLLDPATDKVVNNPALCVPAPDPTTGTCPLAQGLATLDGFSTTALITSGTSAPVVVSTVNANTVFLYELSSSGTPTRVKEVTEGAGATFVAEPPQLGKTAGGATCTAADVTSNNCFSTAIGLQPAVPVPVPTSVSPTGILALPPLKEKTEYAVLVTDGVKDTTGSSLKRSTTSSILLLDQQLVDASGKSQVGGQPDATAAGLEQIRKGVAAAAAALQAEKGIAKDRVVLGYTFRTQTITTVASQLAAAPFAQAAQFVPQGTPLDVTTVAAAGGAPLTNVQKVFAVTVPTLNPIDPLTGALNPDPTKWAPTAMNALVAVPAAGTGTPAAPRAAPLVIFQHGLGRTKSDALAIVSALATAGFVTAAIDAPLHGDRALCATDADCTCSPLENANCAGTTPKCNVAGPFGGAAGATNLGFCSAGSTITAAKSGAFFVSPNLFMTRDALRESILDVSALALALAPPPPATPTNGFASALAQLGVAVDPSKVYWGGQSLGGILGTLNTAANPRIGRAVLNVPGGTVADVFTQSPSFQPQVNALLTQLGITPGSPQFLLFVNVAKWVLDSGEPLNFAGHLIANPLPSQIPAVTAQPKNVFAQWSICDQVIPNPFNLLLIQDIGLTPNQGPNGFASYAVTGAGTPGACAAPNVNPAHGFLLSPTDKTAVGQGDLATYLVNLTVPATNR